MKKINCIVIVLAFLCIHSIQAQDKSIIFPKEAQDNRSEKTSILTHEQTFLSTLLPPTNAYFRPDHLLKNSKIITTYLSAEEVVKQPGVLKENGMYWGYVADSKSKFVIALNIVLGDKSKNLIKLHYGDLPFNEKLPGSITELIKQFPNLNYLYETQSTYLSTERVIVQDIERRSLTYFKNDSLAYLVHNFSNRDILYIDKSFANFLKDMQLKARDYRILKTSENQVFGLLIKYTRDHCIFMYLKNGNRTDDNNLSLNKLTGEIAIMSIVNVDEEMKRINDQITRTEHQGITKIERDETLLKKFYML